MKAEIFAVGTELLMGELTDSNGAWIATQLPALGIQLQYMTIIGDDLGQLVDAFERGLKRSDIIFTTGGLGPTQDDLTREAVAAALGEAPVVQQEVVENLKRYFAGRGVTMPQSNIKQAHLIPSARFIPNPNGTAPGWWTEKNGKIIVNMPGPPGEMHPMFENQVAPRLREIVTAEVTITRNIKTMGLSEAAVDETVAEYFGKENPYLGIYSKADGIHLRVIARAHNEAAARALIAPVEEAITTRLADYVWGFDDETPEQAAAQLLMERGLTLATMESCTGGFLANCLTDIPHATKYYRGGVVAYTNDMKIASGVPGDIIEKYGAISQDTANAMARAVRERLNADYGIGITGVAGPEPLEGQSPGTVLIAVVGPNDAVKEIGLRVPPRRIVVKRRAANTALIELKKLIMTTKRG